MIRKLMIEKRNSLTVSEVQKASASVLSKLKELKQYKEAKTIAIYFPIRNEIEIYIHDKIVCYPKVSGNDIEFYIPNSFSKGAFGIMEPIGEKVNKDDIDIVIVPLLAIDKQMNRLGYGRGYYDRFLHDYKGLKIGVGYNFQEVEEIKKQEWDVPLDIFIKGEY